MCYPLAVTQTWSDDQWKAWEKVAMASDPDYVPLMAERTTDSGEDVWMAPPEEHASEEPEPVEVEPGPLPDLSNMTPSQQWAAFLTPREKGIEEWHAEPDVEQWDEPREGEWGEQNGECYGVEHGDGDENGDGQPHGNHDPRPSEIAAAGARSTPDTKRSPPVKWSPLTPEGVSRFTGTLDAVKFKAEQVAKFKNELLSMSLESVIDWVAWKGGSAYRGLPRVHRAHLHRDLELAGQLGA